MAKPTVIDEVEQRLQAAEASCGSYADDPGGFHARHRAAMAELAEQLAERFDARISVRWDGCRVTIAGISATSTTGLYGALRNWIRAARRKEAQQP